MYVASRSGLVQVSCTVLGWIQLVSAVKEVEIVGHCSQTTQKTAVPALKNAAVRVQGEARLRGVHAYLRVKAVE